MATLKNLVNQTNAATANVWNNSKAAHERAVTAGTSAADAAGSAGLASSRAAEALGSAGQASGYASTAATAAGNANASWSQIQKLYLGAKAAHPTTDHQGQPLQEGTWYTNSSTGFWYWWKDGAWKVGVGDLSSVDWDTQITNKPDTLAGYGITDAATDAELAATVAAAVANMVTTDTTQTVSGHKRFTGNVVVGSSTSNSATVSGAGGPTVQIGANTFLQERNGFSFFTTGLVHNGSNYVATRANSGGTMFVWRDSTVGFDFYTSAPAANVGDTVTLTKIGALGAGGNLTVLGNVTAFGAP